MDMQALEDAARARVDRMAFDYVAGGAGEERTVVDNSAAWGRIRLRPRMLRDVSTVTTSTTVLGTPVCSPVLIAPTAMHRLVCADGELATARAGAAAGTVYVVSMAATTALEDIAAAAPDGARWMQVYIQRDRGLTRAVCERARAAGYRGIVVTVDSPVTSNQTRNTRNGFNVPAGLCLPNMTAGSSITPDIFQLVAAYDATLTFDDLEAIREWGGGLPLVVKGIVRGDDARACVDVGVDAVAVSNHGGRQVDTCISTADALTEVVDAVAGRAEIYVDGGIRHATDVLKALAMGARAVLVGRPIVWGIAVDGDRGALAVLETLQVELARAMGLCGVASVDDIPGDLVVGSVTSARG